MTAGELDEPSAARLVDAIGDWKDADDLRRPNGAEAADYQAAGSPYLPANALFETVPELQRVLGMTPALYREACRQPDRPHPSGGHQPGIRVARDVAGIARRDAGVVDTYLAAAARRAGGQTAAAAVSGGGIAGGGAINLWRIRAEVTMDDGVRLRARSGDPPGGPAPAADGAGVAGWHAAPALVDGGRGTK